MFETIAEMMEECNKQGIKLHQLIIQEEISTSGYSEEKILKDFQKTLDIMKESLEKGNEIDVELPIKEAMEQSQKMMSAPVFLSKDMKEAVYWAMSIGEYNSGMGLICAAPTAGSAGVFPATLFKAQQMLNKSDNELLEAALVGAEIGAIIGNNASHSGSEAGCQAEIGVASAMAAAAITYLAGGKLDEVAQTVALTLKNILGLVCDPVAGLVISPCIKRNALGVMNAFLAAEMALSGVTSIIPPDEVVEAMMKVGRKMAYELKETGLGGIANTPTGNKIRKQLFGDN